MNGFTLARVADALRAAGLLVEQRGDAEGALAGITDDSRAVRPGALFIAVRGSARDGHDFLDAAAAQGAAAAVVEDPTRTTLPALVVNDGRRAAAVAAAAAYGEPATALRFVGVTGTSGKTTTVGMLRHVFDGDAGRSASIGTLGVLLGSAGEPVEGGGGLTTPGPVELQRVLRLLVDAGVRTVAMEVSSHSLDQHRVDGLWFDAAVFTNLTRDHLDYHHTMEAYFAAKARFIEYLKVDGVAVTNADDPVWEKLPPAPRRVTFGLRPGAQVTAADVSYTVEGSRFTLAARATGAPAEVPETASVTLPLIGDFNVANALGAAAAARALGLPLDHVARRLSSLPQVPGRLEIIAERPTVLRDYAHKPDAMERALHAVRPFVEGKLVVVFGCGGDRDKGKRPVMGEIAERLADVVILTSDNPRTEDPERILDDIEAGMTRPHERIEDRRAAIARALELAGPRDVVLLAGKGHETYQIRGTEKRHFDEREIVDELRAERAGARA